MRRKKIPYDNGIAHWCVIREEASGKLVNKYSFGTRDEAEEKKIEQEEAANPPGVVWEVFVETSVLPDEPPIFLTGKR